LNRLQQTLQALVELTRSVDGRDRQVRPGGVADEERIACEDEPGLFGPAAIDDREATVLGAMPWGVEHPQRDVAEHDLLSLLERVVLVRGFRGRVDGDRDPVLKRQPPVSGDVVGVSVRLERAHDSHALLFRRREILLDRVGGIDDDRLMRLRIADEIRRAAEVVVDELPEDHASDRNIGRGLFS